MDVSRYCGTEELRLKLEFVTPCFLGGADGKQAELRTAPFKGMIRYWWRVLYGAKYGSDIRTKENEIFGSASDNKSHASNVRIEVSCDEPVKKSSAPFAQSPMDVLNYLAYGKRKAGKNTEDSEYIDVGNKFNLDVKVSKILDEELIHQVFQSVLYFVRYGGIGSKCRNGFGSMNQLDKKSTVNIEKFIIDDNIMPQRYSALSKDSEIFATTEDFEDWKNALRNLGEIYKETKEKNKKSGELRSPKTMLLHIRKNGKKYSGQILTIPRSDIKLTSVKLKQNEKLKDNTANALKGGAK